jgi:hypothetical protein
MAIPILHTQWFESRLLVKAGLSEQFSFRSIVAQLYAAASLAVFTG